MLWYTELRLEFKELIPLSTLCYCYVTNYDAQYYERFFVRSLSRICYDDILTRS